MPTIEKRGKKWRSKVRRDGVNLSHTFDTKAEAMAWAGDMDRKVKAGQHHVYGDRTLADLMEESENVRTSRWEINRLRWFAKQDIGRIRLAELTPRRLEIWRDERLKVCATETVRRDLTLLSAVLIRGRDILGWLPASPLSKVRRPPEGDPRERKATQEEIETICHVAGYVVGTPPETKIARVAAAFTFATETGLMPVEMERLTPAWVVGRVCHCPKVKTRPRREVPLSPLALQILKDVGGAFGVSTVSMDALWREHIRPRAGCLDMTFYDSRATALTKLAAKYSILELAKISGHRDINRLKVYYRGTGEELAERLHAPESPLPPVSP